MEDVVDTILNPRAIAVVGASRDAGKRGHRVIRTLLSDGYKGKIFPINPREKEILGLKCYPSISEVADAIDVALVFTPAATLPDIVEECGKKGVKGAVVIAGGFSEVGEEGRLLEERSVAIAQRLNVRIVGPNLNGIFSARHNYNAIGWRNVPRGNIAVITNSSNVALHLLLEAQTRGHVGFSVMFSVGNQADVQFHEYLQSIGRDTDTKAVISYVEGFRNGRAYLDAARAVTPRKPVVLYKAGRSSAGVRLAKSHSASLAGEYAVSSGALKQAGVILVDRSDHLLPITEALSLLPPMRSRRVGIVSEGGGPITIAAEALTEHNMELPQLSERTQNRIKAIIPRSSLISNPVDVGAGTLPMARNYGLCARAMLEDPNIDALLFVGYFGGYTARYGKPADGKENQASEEIDICLELGRLMNEFGKPIVVQCHYAEIRPEALELLRQSGIPYHRSIELAAECVCAAADYSAARRRLERSSPNPGYAVSEVAQKIIRGCRAEGREALFEFEARELLAAYRVPLPPYLFVESRAQLALAGNPFADEPVAVKVMSRDILHKSDANGVMLNVKGEEAIRAAVEAVIANGRKYKRDAVIRGALVSPMARKGVELIVGVAHDPQFGPVIMFGAGGIFVEVMRDVVFRALPIDAEDAQEMLKEIKSKALLEGVRGVPPVDKAALIELLLAVSSISQTHPELAEFELNPIIAHESGYSIVDVRIILAPEPAANAAAARAPMKTVDEDHDAG